MATGFRTAVTRGGLDDGFLTKAVDLSGNTTFGRLGAEPLTVQAGGRSADDQDGGDAAFEPQDTAVVGPAGVPGNIIMPADGADRARCAAGFKHIDLTDRGVFP